MCIVIASERADLVVPVKGPIFSDLYGRCIYHNVLRSSKYRLDAEVEETTLFREPRALDCRRPERQRGRY